MKTCNSTTIVQNLAAISNSCWEVFISNTFPGSIYVRISGWRFAGVYVLEDYVRTYHITPMSSPNSSSILIVSVDFGCISSPPFFLFFFLFFFYFSCFLV
jgi:hypothetical protein